MDQQLNAMSQASFSFMEPDKSPAQQAHQDAMEPLFAQKWALVDQVSALAKKVSAMRRAGESKAAIEAVKDEARAAKAKLAAVAIKIQGH